MDHNELLKMYRNWKKSESVIKFKNDEIKMLKNNSKYFEDSNIKLRGQVQALESVRDLVSTFQIQLSSLREENLQLKKENSELMELNQQVEFTLNQRLVDENHQIQQLTLVHENFKTLAEKYEKLEKSTKENSSNNVQEKVHNQSLETEIILLQTKLNQSKKEIYELNEKLSTANNRLTECDKELAHASNQLYNLSLEISYYTQTQKESSCNQWEIELLKNDISRLLKLVVHIPASSEFLKCWQDNQALSYIGGQSDPENINIKSFLNSSIHHDHDDECFIRHWNEAGFASSSELSHLKRIHYTSDVPSSIDLPTSFNDDIKEWVPRLAASESINFLKSYIPHVPNETIFNFLKRMNKIWQRVGRRRIRRIKEDYERVINDLRRQLKQSRPYRGVMADRQIKLLKGIINKERKRKYDVRIKRGDDPELEDLKDFDSDGEQELIKVLPAHHRRLCQEVKRLENLMKRTKVEGESHIVMDELAAKNLLEASLISLDILGRQVANKENLDGNIEKNAISHHVLQSMLAHHSNEISRSSIDILNDDSMDEYYKNNQDMEQSKNDSFQLIPNFYKRDPFLQGAIWLSRNLNVIVNEVFDDVEEEEKLHIDHVCEKINHILVSNKENNRDVKETCESILIHLYQHLETIFQICDEGKNQVRDMIESASLIRPGDSEGLKKFIELLPIERNDK